MNLYYALIGRNAFSFDRVFGTESKQCDVYDFAAKPVVQDALNGFNWYVPVFV